MREIADSTQTLLPGLGCFEYQRCHFQPSDLAKINYLPSISGELKLPLLTSPSCLNIIDSVCKKNAFIHHQIDTQELPPLQRQKTSELWTPLLLNEYKRCDENKIYDCEYLFQHPSEGLY